MQEESRLTRSSPAGNRRRLSLSAAAGFLLVSSVLGQAWLAPKGEASFGATYQNIYTRDHLFGEGRDFDRGRIRMNVAVFGFTYSFTDRLAVSASLPYVSARYAGSNPHDGGTDDGSYHGNLTDFRLDVRCNILEEPAVVTPFVAAVLPVTDYPTFAHAATSSGLEQYLVGVNIGRRLDPILEAGFVQLRYSYAFAEKVLDVSHDRSNVDLEIGYFLTPAIGVSAVGSYQQTHGGIVPPNPGTPEARAFINTPYYLHHDQISKSNFFNVGGIVSYALTGAIDVFASYQATVWGENMHPLQPGLAVGFSWGFSPRRVIRSFARKSASSGASTE